MEFQGRIARLLPMRSGTSQKGEWQALPFVFEYFENPTDRYADSVVLETFDTKVIENLKENMEVICGFGHRAKEITKTDGTQVTINEIRLYKIESVRKAAAQPHAQPTPASQPAPQPNPFGPQTNQEGGENGDDLPF